MPQLSPVELAIAGALILMFLGELYFYLRYMRGVRRLLRRSEKGEIGYADRQPGVSVIICARDEAENLTNFLPSVLEQDYPEFEVIVINDGSTDSTQDVLNHYALQYPQLRLTFVPLDAHVISTKKLGLTLGIKAAKYDYLLFTDADCRPESRQWIAHMMRNFTPGTDFVLGYGAYLQKQGMLNSLISYDTLTIGLQYMGMALAGKPYMGVGRNMAYRKKLFLDNRGFAGTLSMRSGDDDLFVNRLATARNTRVEASRESVTWSPAKNTWNQWQHQKQRHLSVSPHYSMHSKMQLGWEPIARGLFYALSIALCCTGNWQCCAIAAVLLLTRYIVQVCIINKASRHFGQRRYGIGVLLFDIFLPLNDLWLLTIGRQTRRKHSLYW